MAGRWTLALGAGRWVSEQLLFRVVPAAVGVIGATVWESNFPIVGRVAIGALLGEAASLLMQAAIDFRTRDLGERATLEVGDAAVALRESELFIASLPGDSFDYSRGPRAALAVVLAAIRGPGLRFHFAQAEFKGAQDAVLGWRERLRLHERHLAIAAAAAAARPSDQYMGIGSTWSRRCRWAAVPEPPVRARPSFARIVF